MEMEHHWAQVGTIFLSPEKQSQTNWRNIVSTLDKGYLSKPFAKMKISCLMNLPVDPITKIPANHKVTVHTYTYKGEEKPLSTVLLKKTSKMLLQDFINLSKKQKEITLIEFLRDKRNSSYEFKYVNSETFKGQVDYKSVGFGWDLHNNGIGGKENPGINVPFLYIGWPGAVSPLHLEESNLRSINVHFGGADKIWFGIENEDIPKLEDLLSTLDECNQCPYVFRHKIHFWDTELLTKNGIRVYKTVQKKGDIIITNSFHQVVNLGYNVNIAVNFWVGGSELQYTQNGNHCPLGRYAGPRSICKFDYQSTILNRFVADVKIYFLCIDENCRNVFHSKTNLRIHAKNVHDLEVSKDVTAECPVCYKHFAKPEAHLQKAHGDLLSVYCVFCRTKQNNMTALRKHWRLEHVEKQDLKCKNCNKKTAKSFRDIFHEHAECLEK